MQLIVCDSKNEIAEIVSNKIITMVNDKPNAILGLATGSSPIETYKQVANKALKQNVSFAKVKSFNLDEYVNCKDITQTYRYFMDQTLFKHIDIDLNSTFFPGCANPSQYDVEISQAGGIDLQILGIGANGHIGFNEPNTSFDSTTHIVELTKQTIQDNSRFFNSIDDVPKYAVTMGLATIMHAKEIVLIAIGDNKSNAIKRAFDQPDVNCPASVLLLHHNATVICDKNAAKMINKND